MTALPACKSSKWLMRNNKSSLLALCNPDGLVPSFILGRPVEQLSQAVEVIIWCQKVILTELFDVHCKSIAKVFDAWCQGIQSAFQNHRRSALQNHLIRVAKPFDLRVSKPFDLLFTAVTQGHAHSSTHRCGIQPETIFEQTPNQSLRYWEGKWITVVNLGIQVASVGKGSVLECLRYQVQIQHQACSNNWDTTAPPKRHTYGQSYPFQE